MQLILGSQSPRRREVLSFFNLPFKQVSPHFDEDSIPFNDNPQEYVKTLAKGKAHSLITQFPTSVILAADTIVYKQGKIYGKPRDEKEAFEYLKELSGQWHSVFTGLSIYSQGQDFQTLEETRVLFNELTEEQMQIYHHILEFADKAGGYMIQGAGSVIVKRIEGCYYNVVGLPVNALCSILRKVGINLWQHLKGFKS
jgi:septum formation protein